MPTLAGRPLSNTNLVNDLRDDDQVPIVRLSEPLPQDQNAHMSGGRLKELLGGNTAGPVSPGITLYAGPGTHTDGAMSQKAATEYADRGPNDRPDGFKSVRFLTRTDPRFDQASDFKALDELDTTKGCLGATCYVDFAATRYVLAYDAAPRREGVGTGPQCWRDGHMQAPTPLVPCRWLPLDAPGAQVKDYTEYPAGYVFTTGTYVGAYVSGSTTEQFFKATTPDGPRPAPTGLAGDTYWQLVSGTDVPVVTTYQPRATIAASLFVALLASPGGLAQYVNKDLYITRAAGLGTVVARVLGNGAFAGDDAYLFDAANPDLPATPVSVAVVNGALVVSGRGEGTTVLPAVTKATSDDITGFATLAAAAAGGMDDCQVALWRGVTLLDADVTLGGGALYGNGSIINITAGKVLRVIGGCRVYDTVFADSAPHVGNGSDSPFSRCFFQLGLTVEVNSTARLLDSTVLTGPVSVAGRLLVGVGCDVSGAVITLSGAGSIVYQRPVIDTFSVLPYAASIAVDFNAETVRTLALTGNVAFTAAANIALLKTKELYLTNTTGAAITLSFPAGWSFFPGPAPTTLAAGKQAVLTLRSLGTTDATIKAAYVAQA